MKLKSNYFYTIREDIKDEESTSSNLLVRSGMIKKVGAGIYMYMPMGLKVLNKIEKIVKEEMDNSGAQEVLMPSLIPLDYYEACGRVSSLGDSMFKLTDRYNRAYALGPTHEELFTMAATNMVHSYKDLPFILYQQADKFRDEPRPRYGLIRVREFIMKDAYSFDKDEDGLDISYNKMKEAYNKIFDRIGINYKRVIADTGVMGGSLSEEYQAITDIGEDTVVLCDSCDFSSNIEVTECVSDTFNSIQCKDLELISTLDNESIEEVCNFLNIEAKDTLKAILLNINEELVICFIRGDRELNENKVSKLFKSSISFASDELIGTSNAVAGSTGPINLENAKVVIDREVLNMKNFCCGSNKKGYHYINANLKDFKYDIVSDIVNVKEGDVCPKCGGKLYFKKGIEIGNLFKLGIKYSSQLGLTFKDVDNKDVPVVMGSYGIGVGRILASVVEQNNDEFGLILPVSIAPYEVAIVIINSGDEKQVDMANSIYESLKEKNVDVLLDDRDERPGVKFKDMDLLGIPLRITVGKKINENIVEVKLRKETDFKEMNISDLEEFVIQYIKDNRK